MASQSSVVLRIPHTVFNNLIVPILDQKLEFLKRDNYNLFMYKSLPGLHAIGSQSPKRMLLDKIKLALYPPETLIKEDVEHNECVVSGWLNLFSKVDAK